MAGPPVSAGRRSTHAFCRRMCKARRRCWFSRQAPATDRTPARRGLHRRSQYAPLPDRRQSFTNEVHEDGRLSNSNRRDQNRRRARRPFLPLASITSARRLQREPACRVRKATISSRPSRTRSKTTEIAQYSNSKFLRAAPRRPAQIKTR